VKTRFIVLLGVACAAALCGSLHAQVTFQRIAKADQDPGNWLTYSRNYAGHRFSPLNEINRGNVANLKVKWAYQLAGERNEVSPIVVNGVMYITGANSAAALDARTGRTLWTWTRPIPSDYHNIGFGRVNRGPAILDDKLLVTTLDCYIVALDARSGAQLWSTAVADYHLGYSMTVAPLATDGKVIVGVSGGEAGIRGFVDAYETKTGQRAWRFWTIPGKGEPGNDTWAGDSWKTGGGSTWVTGVYDPELQLVYWGVGNPGPDWNGDKRAGDNLYTCSLVALEADSGRLRWHFQFSPHETHDWDAAHVPILLNAKINGKERKLIVNANRNAFYYVLDRETGEFIRGRPYAKQTWAKGLDSGGRPIVVPDTEPSDKGVLVYPNLNGATVWQSPSYSPQTNLFYVSVREIGSVYFKKDAEYQPGTFFAGGGEDALPADDAWGAIRALEPTTGEMRWEFKLHSPPWAGVLSTAGGLVFSGSDEGNFYALDAKTGKSLWDFQTGGPIGANPISYQVDGRQYVAISANQVLFVFGL
jgi:alcohol dehydrogenase (cytochrome c)